MELDRAEQATKDAASHGGAYVGVVSQLTGTAVGGAIQCSESAKQFDKGDVQMPKEVIGNLAVGDAVLFRVGLDDRGVPHATFTRRLEEITNQRQVILEAEAPLPPSGAMESTQEFLGFIASFQPDPGFGFISCAETRQAYGGEVYIHRDQMANVNVGDGVRFRVVVNHKGLPVARGVRKAIEETPMGLGTAPPMPVKAPEPSRAASASGSPQRRSRSRSHGRRKKKRGRSSSSGGDRRRRRGR